ncbi:uncharacterized protein LOC120330362 [Styela clava]
MGASSSSSKKLNEEQQKRKRLLQQRKVTNDILEKLARSLPQVPNQLGKTLRLDSEVIKELEWKGNLSYLEKWKLWKKDDATIGNLITLLKDNGIKEDVWECLFNISREPKNATTAMELTDTVLMGNSLNHYEFSRKPSTACRVSPLHLPNEVFPDPSLQQTTTSARIWHRDITTASRRNSTQNGVRQTSLHQRLDQYPQESLLEDILRNHDRRSSDRDCSLADSKSPLPKESSLHASVGNSQY